MTLLTFPVGHGRARSAWRVSLLVLSAAAGCEFSRPRATRDSTAGKPVDTVAAPSNRFATDASLSISSDGRIAPAIRTLADRFAAREAVQVLLERTELVGAASSRQHERTPDIVAVDAGALSRLPNAEVSWHIRFARDRIVLASRDSERATAVDSTTVYGLSIPSDAPNARYAERFVRFVLSPDGERILRAAHLEPLEPPSLTGTKAPPAIVAMITAMGTTRSEQSHDTMSAAHPTGSRRDSALRRRVSSP